MLLLNAHVAIAEEHVSRLEPELYSQQARLRAILDGHPVFQQNYHLEDWFRKGSSMSYIGCGLVSKLFTNAYVSIGARTRGCHTDYRNPPITHLSTRLRGGWKGAQVTGQTVLFDRFATTALVVDDSRDGKVLLGGLNGVKHANLGPLGDVKS